MPKKKSAKAKRNLRAVQVATIADVKKLLNVHKTLQLGLTKVKRDIVKIMTHAHGPPPPPYWDCPVQKRRPKRK
jgi:hypothetical protein